LNVLLPLFEDNISNVSLFLIGLTTNVYKYTSRYHSGKSHKGEKL